MLNASRISNPRREFQEKLLSPVSALKEQSQNSENKTRKKRKIKKISLEDLCQCKNDLYVYLKNENVNEQKISNGNQNIHNSNNINQNNYNIETEQEITIPDKLRSILASEINPIINPINSNLKTDILVSIKLIRYLEHQKYLCESISLITQAFIQRVIEERDLHITHGFAYVLSRVTKLSRVQNQNLVILFFNEFKRYIPWINFFHPLTSNQYLEKHNKPFNYNTAKEIQCLFSMILEWFSYDTELVEYLSIPIITNVINDGDIEKVDGYLIEAFYKTTGLIAKEACPTKFAQVNDIYDKKLKKNNIKHENKDTIHNPSIVRLEKNKNNLPNPYKLKYENIISIKLPDDDEEDAGYYISDNDNIQIVISEDIKNSLINEITPILNPINSNLKTDIIVSIKLIQYLEKQNNLLESVFIIAQFFIQRVVEERDLSVTHGFAYVLSRVVKLAKIENQNLEDLFYNIFKQYIPYIDLDRLFTVDQYLRSNNKNFTPATASEIQCLFSMILEWFSYDIGLVKTKSIPIIMNIINGKENCIDFFVEAFLKTTGLIAKEETPNELNMVFTSIERRLYQQRQRITPSLIRLREIVREKTIKMPFTLKHKEIQFVEEAENDDDEEVEDYNQFNFMYRDKDIIIGNINISQNVNQNLNNQNINNQNYNNQNVNPSINNQNVNQNINNQNVNQNVKNQNINNQNVNQNIKNQNDSRQNISNQNNAKINQNVNVNIAISDQLRSAISKEITPIINRISTNLKTSIMVSIDMIRYLENQKHLVESVILITESFMKRVEQEHVMEGIHGFSYVLSRVTKLTKIKNQSLEIIFLNVFKQKIPWIDTDNIFTSNQYFSKNNKLLNKTTTSEIQCLFAMIIEWFSYDFELVRTKTIPIILNIINKGAMEAVDGYFIEAFFKTTGFILKEAFPNDLNNIMGLLKKKLAQFNGKRVAPSIMRLQTIIEHGTFKMPYTLKYYNIEFAKEIDTGKENDE